MKNELEIKDLVQDEVYYVTEYDEYMIFKYLQPVDGDPRRVWFSKAITDWDTDRQNPYREDQAQVYITDRGLRKATPLEKLKLEHSIKEGRMLTDEELRVIKINIATDESK